MTIDPVLDVTTSVDREVCVMRLVGEVDLATAPQVEAAAAPHRQLPRMVLDLRDVSYLDSAGLRVVHVLASRHDLCIVAPDDSIVHPLLVIAGLREVVGIVDDLEQARASFASRTEAGAVATPGGPPKDDDARRGGDLG